MGHSFYTLLLTVELGSSNGPFVPPSWGEKPPLKWAWGVFGQRLL